MVSFNMCDLHISLGNEDWVSSTISQHLLVKVDKIQKGDKKSEQECGLSEANYSYVNNLSPELHP